MNTIARKDPRDRGKRMPMHRMLASSGLALGMALALAGCSESSSRTHAVYMLVDISGTYAEEVSKAQQIVNFTLAKLYPGDSFAVATINSASFTEQNVIARVTFDGRPSYATQQKQQFGGRMSEFAAGLDRGSAFTDITGGVLQATEWLNEVGAPRKTILLFSDLLEDLSPGYFRDLPLELEGVRVVAVNVIKLRTDNVDPRDYTGRVDAWKERVEAGGGEWVMINDLERLDPIIS
jgi:hypothetical protein